MRMAAVVVVLLLVAGCAGVPVSPPGDASIADGRLTPDITVVNGTLPVDPGALYHEVSAMLGTAAAGPETIDVEPNEQMAIVREPMPPFFRLLGVDRPAGTDRAATALGYVAEPSTVHVHQKLLDDPRQLRLTLVHEYVHVVQGRTGAFAALDRSIPGRNTTDGGITRSSVLEGVAVSVETAYWRTHDGEGTSPAEGMATSYAVTEGARQWIFARYHFGYRYVQSRTDSLEEASRLYERPPHTAEELIHRLPGGSEPMPPLTVAVDRPDWHRNGTDRTGELFVRVALDTHLGSTEAADAAAGWGTDARVALTRGDARAYVWALRFDDAANATEFRSAMAGYLDERASIDDGVWTDGDAAFRMRRVGPQTVALALGNESFVRSTTLSGTNGRVVAQKM